MLNFKPCSLVKFLILPSIFLFFSVVIAMPVHAASCYDHTDASSCAAAGCTWGYYGGGSTQMCYGTSSDDDSSSVSYTSLSASKCEVDRVVYNNNLLVSPQGIPLTVTDFATALVSSGFTAVMGRSITEVAGCGGYFLSKCQLPGRGVCTQTPSSTCDELVNSIGFTGGSFDSYANSTSPTKGSLLGMAYVVQNAALQQPLPISLAYYTNTTLAKVPFLGTAMAQTTSAQYTPLMKSIFGAWQVMRNLAYAAIAAVLLYIGILIIMRKRVNQQLVVSVQYALPRIVLGVVLITFSYPIGAALGSLGWILFTSGYNIAATVLGSSFSVCSTLPSIGLVIVGLLGLIAASTVTGGASIVLLGIAAIALIGMLVFLLVKALSIYIKILFSILTAPLEFVLGVVPGSEDKIKEWFLRMIKYVVTLFGMGFIVWFGLFLSLTIVTGATEEFNVFGYLIGVFLPIIVIIYSFGLASGMEGHVEGFLGIGVKKKK